MTSVDPAFKGAGQKPGLEIWRIEKLKVVSITDQSKFGKFHSGDSYIVLFTEKTDSGYRWDIHFWLGKETSQDEAGIAAYKTVELDDSLGGAPVQNREVEGHESQQFMNLFKNYGGVKYLAGGVESGFKKVDRDAYETRLLHVKGKRNVRVSEVAVSCQSLNQGDVFILDKGLTIYQWNGSKASRAEKAKAMEVSRQIKDAERGGRARVMVIESGEDSKSEAVFFDAIGGKGAIAEAKDDDDEFEKKKNQGTKLYRVSDASGSVKIEEVASAPLKKSHLDTNDAFILDTAQQLFVWIGKQATKQEKNQAWTMALDFITKKGYPVHTPVTRLVEGGETTIFIQQFSQWPAPENSANFSFQKRTPPGDKKTKAIDFKKIQSKERPEKQKAVDDGSGKLEVWRVENFEKVPVEKSSYGHFYQGDSYVLLYTYMVNTKENYIIYFWQGNDSTQDEKGASALLATQLDDQYGGAPVQVRVIQNKEPDHFLGLFKGKFIIHKGGVGSGFKNSNQGDEYDTDGTRLFHIRGTNELNTKAVQVDEVASSLNSNDTFVLEKEKEKVIYTWFGKYATGDERAIAKSVAERLAADKKISQIESVFEGQEKDDFWNAIGGKTEYFTAERPCDALSEPRLFQCSNASGNFDMEEIFDFAQEDLISEDVMILDAGSEVFVWIGVDANDIERKESLKSAIEYIKHSDGRDPETTPIMTVKQGFEPPLFTQHFQAWDAEKAKSGLDNYEEMKKELEAAGANGVTSVSDELAKFSKKYDYNTLMTRPLPDGVDAANLDNHLLDEEFQTVFKMSREQYDSLPKWKRENKKKEVKLF